MKNLKYNTKMVYNHDYYKQLVTHIPYAKHEYHKLFKEIVLDDYIELQYQDVSDDPNSDILIKTKINNIIFYIVGKSVYIISDNYIGEMSVCAENSLTYTSARVKYICDL